MQHYAEHANSVIQCILITAPFPPFLPLSLSLSLPFFLYLSLTQFQILIAGLIIFRNIHTRAVAFWQLN